MWLRNVVEFITNVCWRWKWSVRSAISSTVLEGKWRGYHNWEGKVEGVRCSNGAILEVIPQCIRYFVYDGLGPRAKVDVSTALRFLVKAHTRFFIPIMHGIAVMQTLRRSGKMRNGRWRGTPGLWQNQQS